MTLARQEINAWAGHPTKGKMPRGSRWVNVIAKGCRVSLQGGGHLYSPYCLEGVRLLKKSPSDWSVV